jgi:O-antigen/teichoic acid export membrane protein
MLAFILLPLYTRYLSPEDYGKVDVIFAVTVVVIPIVTMQVGFACYRFLFDSNDPADQRELISNTMAVFLSGSLAFSALYLAFIAFVPVEYGLAILLFIVLGGLSQLMQTLVRGLRKNALYSVLGVVSTVAMLTANLVFIVGYNMKSIALLLAPICGNIAVIVIAAARLKLFSFLDFRLLNLDKIRSLLTYSAPLVPDSICWWLMLGFGRVYLNYQDGPEAVGIFAVANKFPTLLTTFYSIFILAWKENAITQFTAEDRDAYYSAVYNRQIKIILGAIIVLLPATRLVIEFLLGDAFRSCYQYVPLLFLSAALSMFAAFWGPGFESAKKTSGILISTLWAFAANLIANVLLVPVLSIYGVAIANVAAYSVLYITRMKQSRKFFTITTEIMQVSVLALIAAVFALLFYIPTIWIQWAIFIAGFVIAAFFNYDTLMKLFQKLRELY